MTMIALQGTDGRNQVERDRQHLTYFYRTIFSSPIFDVRFGFNCSEEYFPFVSVNDIRPTLYAYLRKSDQAHLNSIVQLWSQLVSLRLFDLNNDIHECVKRLSCHEIKFPERD